MQESESGRPTNQDLAVDRIRQTIPIEIPPTLDVRKHQYLAVNRRGRVLGRFSTVTCAARTATNYKNSVVLTPEGYVLNFQSCVNLLNTRHAEEEFHRCPENFITSHTTFSPEVS